MSTEIAYGNKYEATKDMSRAEIAKLVRTDIKDAIAKGALPKAKYSVRVRSFAGGGAIDIKFSHVVEDGFALFNAERLEFDIVHGSREFTRLPLYSERATHITKTLDAILAAYNFDGSDSQTDYFHVRFYGHAVVCWEWERDMLVIENERTKDAMAVRAAKVLEAKETALASTIPAPAIAANDTRVNPEDFNDEFPEAVIFPAQSTTNDQVLFLASLGIEV